MDVINEWGREGKLWEGMGTSYIDYDMFWSIYFSLCKLPALTIIIIMT